MSQRKKAGAGGRDEDSVGTSFERMGSVGRVMRGLGLRDLGLH